MTGFGLPSKVQHVQQVQNPLITLEETVKHSILSDYLSPACPCTWTLDSDLKTPTEHFVIFEHGRR